MTTPDRDDPDAAPASAGRLLPSRRELALIAAVWAAYALLTIATRLFDRRWDRLAELATPAAVAAIEALGWAVLTIPILALADRFDVDRPRATRVLVFALAGVAVAVGMGWLSGELRQAFSPPRPPRELPAIEPGGASPEVGPGGGGRRGGRRMGPPVWFAMGNALVLYLAVLAAGVARSYSRRYQARREEAARREARLEAQLAEARLAALQRQLDPHFLFNTLNAVSALVERDPRGVRRMIARLSELLRFSIEGADRPEVPLREELALLGRYVEIMQVRFQGRLTVETRVDDAALDAPVPTLILQPLVENAIKHGAERVAGPSCIEIEARVDGGDLLLRVSDDGPGLAAAPPRGGVGVGLRNTIARLEQLYGARQRFSIAPRAASGTVAEIRLPYRAAAEPVEVAHGG